MDKNGWPESGEEMLQWFRDHWEASPGVEQEGMTRMDDEIIKQAQEALENAPGGYSTREYFERRYDTSTMTNPGTEKCASSGCNEEGTFNVIWKWIRVARSWEGDRYFCSLRCLANWLAGELAKEESR